MSHSTSGAKNRLAAESSPYLLLHQDNPVDWYAWGEEALAKARAEDKPIFLSVGYSTCYWCHVMERESFSNPATAAILNRHFISIKLDREERPDLDEIYMAATQILGGHGGWPNSVFLTPELKPFYAGTYFPPEERHGLPGFGTLLLSIADAWKNRRGQVNDQADEVAKVMRRYLGERAAPAERVPGAAVVERSREALARRFDREWGGFSPAPKFPTPSNLYFLQELAAESPATPESTASAEMLSVTLDRMARGGLFDHLGGGFHRYATDREWLVPHFEKMLYDNGFLLEIYAREFARTGEPEWARVAAETAAFLAREMTTAEGAFASAIDAETRGHEGAYYVWERAELQAALGAEDELFLAPLLGFDRPPFFEGKAFVLHLPRPLAEVARERRLGREALLAEMAPLKAKLLAAREARERPATDDKVLADWNGIAIAGMVAAGEALGQPEWIDRAERAARFVLSSMRPEGAPLQHVWRLGTAKVPAQLADYAHIVRGLLALDRARPGDGAWLRAARELTDEQIRRLRDPEGGFFVAEAGPDTLVRSKEALDGATPSANAIAADNLMTLARRTGEDRYRAEAEATLRAFGEILERAPDATRMLALAARRYGREFPAPARRSALEEEAERVVTARLELAPAGEGPWQSFVLRLEIAPGWHLNANPASEPSLIPTELHAEGGELRHVHYPAPLERRFAFTSTPLGVYEGKVEISGEMRGEPALTLRYQPCDETRCLPPVERTISR